jgi:hypothetical protein
LQESASVFERGAIDEATIQNPAAFITGCEVLSSL